MTEDVRVLAFDRLLQLPGAEPDSEAADAALEALAPSDRERVLQAASRRLAFQLLYEVDAGGSNDLPRVRRQLAEVHGLGPLAMERVAALVEGAFEHRAVADAEFVALAPEWPTHRQASVDRAILRLAHYEMSRGLAPAKVVVSESVELAKHFSTDKSPPFINALLDRVLKRLETPAPAP